MNRVHGTIETIDEIEIGIEVIAERDTARGKGEEADHHMETEVREETLMIPTPPVATTEPENVKKDMVEIAETTEIGTETVVNVVEMIAEITDVATVIYLMIVEGVAVAIKEITEDHPKTTKMIRMNSQHKHEVQRPIHLHQRSENLHLT